MFSDLVATGRIAVCRDYLLYLLAQNRVLARRDFSDVRRAFVLESNEGDSDHGRDHWRC